MVSTATILEEMFRDIAKQPTMGLNAQIYLDRIRKYAPTYDGMTEDFYDKLFGEFSNRITRQEFIDNLTRNGWQYFNLANLNEQFVLNLERYGTQEAGHLPEFMQEGQTADDNIMMNSSEYGVEIKDDE